MRPYGKVSIARVVHSSQRCGTSRVGSDITVPSKPGPSWRPHSMLNFSGVILIKKVE